ncbi:hypothetical protein TruAng_003902 [Truncatella angustata]|nr:hypothetical protein TruAng_003902 [Truncatella angustata]
METLSELEAGLPLDKTDYVELHGTSTPVGDPLELSAIAATFGSSRTPSQPLYVGSIKQAVGHTKGCASLAGLFKSMLCLEKGIVLPTAEVDQVNPKRKLVDWNLALPERAMDWPSSGCRRISVNSFGFGGANAHVILDDAHHYTQAHALKGKHSTTSTKTSLWPKAVVGHSSGKIAATYAAGIPTHEDAIKVAYLRGVYSERVSQGPRSGRMLAAGISEQETHIYPKAMPSECVVIACVNSPKSVTLSSDVEYIDQLEIDILKDSKFARKLRVATVYHSPLMRMVAEDCMSAMIDADNGEPQDTATVPMFSSVTAPLVQIMELVDKKLPSELPYTSILVSGEDAVTTYLKAAGHVWALGMPVSLDNANQNKPSQAVQVAVDLPSYPWNHEKVYWHESAATKEQRLGQKARTDLLGIAVEHQNPLEPQWRNYLRVRENPWIEDHKITGATLYPGAGMLIMVLEAVREITGGEKSAKGIEFVDVHFDRGLVIPSEGSAKTLLRIQTPHDAESSHYNSAIFSRIGEGSWTKHCFVNSSIVSEGTNVDGGSDLASFEWETQISAFDAIKRLPSREVDVKKFYESLDNVGMNYGPSFRNLASLTVSPENGCSHGTVKIPDTRSVMPYEYEFPHIIDPATLDAIFHLLAAVPYLLERLFISFKQPQGAGSVFTGFGQKANRSDKQLAADLVVSDECWSEPKVIVKGLIMRQVSSDLSNIFSDSAMTSEKKTTNIVWKADPESLLRRSEAAVPSYIEIAGLQGWLELECHKSNGLRVLLVGNTLDGDVLS